MAKEKFLNHTAVALISGAERKLRDAAEEVSENRESRVMARKQLGNIHYACYLLEEARHVLSAADEPPEAETESLPF